MEKIFASLEEPFESPCVLAIGMFDGLHKGHRCVLDTAREISNRKKASLCVLTFSPHPSKVINMGRPPVEMLFDAHSRGKMFEEAGVKKVFVKKFDKPFASLTPDEFEVFLNRHFPKLKGVVTGFNFVFGKGALGTAKTLSEMAKRSGWEYKAVDGVEEDGSRISSSRLRDLVKSGKMQEYARLAGKPYAVYGTVIKGRQLGRKIGFPTLNVQWSPECKPPFGVYGVRMICNGITQDGIANYGLSPTINANSHTPLLETHLVENPTNITYGAIVKVELLSFIRPEKKFDSIDSLKAQIFQDFLQFLKGRNTPFGDCSVPY